MAAGLLVALALLPGVAHAWDSPEHVAIARSAYVWACQNLRALPPGDASSAVRLAQVCPIGLSRILVTRCEEGMDMDALRDATPVPGTPFGFADWITQGAALAGDYFRASDLYDTIDGQRALPSLASYLMLANDNDDHFHPRVTLLAHDELEAAEVLAEEARLAVDHASARAGLLHRAGVRLMFALHFAQDAFAAGHMGFNRAGSSAGPSQRLHAAFNYLGRRVKGAMGDEYVAYGDLSYCRQGARARHRVVAASASALMRVLVTYVKGRAELASLGADAGDLKLDLAAYLPTHAHMAPAIAYQNLFGPGYISSYVYPSAFHTLSTVGDSARQSVSIGGSAVYAQHRMNYGLSGVYVPARSQQSILDFGLVGGAYLGCDSRYRADAGAGARIGFLGTGLATVEAWVRGGLTGRWGKDTSHERFVEPRLQVLVELGQLFYLRLGAGYAWGNAGSSGLAASLDLGYLVGASGGGAVDVRNISRGL